MISLKKILLEQDQYDYVDPIAPLPSDQLGPGADFQPLQNVTRNQDKYVKAALDLTGKTLKDLKTKDIAEIIWNAKGYVSDNEETAIAAILKIKSVSDFNRVEAHFVRRSEGRTIPQYLLSFLEDFQQNYTVLSHLYTIGRKNKTFLNAVIYTYASELLFEYSLPIAKTGQILLKNQGKPFKFGYSQAGKLYKWFQPFLGDANFNKWVKIAKDPESHSVLNKDREEQLFKYDKAKIFSTDAIIVLSLITAVATGGMGGFVLGAGIGLFDAADELRVTGDKQTAGIMVAFEALPFITKIPGVKALVNRIGKTLATKISKGVKYFNSEEQYLLKLTQNNQSKIKKHVSHQVEVTKAFIKDPQIQSWIKTKKPEVWATDLANLQNKQISFKQFKAKVAKESVADYSAKTAIKFSAKEYTAIDALVPKLINKAKQEQTAFTDYIKIKKANGDLANVEIKIVEDNQHYAWAQATQDGYKTDQVFFNSNFVKTASPTKIRTTIVHELGHIKDPALKSKKLTSTYSSDMTKYTPYTSFNLSKDPADAGKTFWSTYYHHPFEINAITPQVTSHMVQTTQKKLKDVGLANTQKALQQIEDWAKGVPFSKWNQDAADILGYEVDDIGYFLHSLEKLNPKEHFKLVKHILKQTTDLKQQILKTQPSKPGGAFGQ